MSKLENLDLYGWMERAEKAEKRVKKLECLLCISHDYLLQHWDMEAEPLREIDGVVKEILKEEPNEHHD